MAYAQLDAVVTTALLMLLVLVTGLGGLCALGSAVLAAVRALRRRRRRKHDARVHAEFARGIVELENYLRQRDASR